MTDLEKAVARTTLKVRAFEATQKAIEHTEAVLGFLKDQAKNDRDAVEAAGEEVAELHRAIVEDTRASHEAEQRAAAEAERRADLAADPARWRAEAEARKKADR